MQHPESLVQELFIDRNALPLRIWVPHNDVERDRQAHPRKGHAGDLDDADGGRSLADRGMGGRQAPAAPPPRQHAGPGGAPGQSEG